MDVWGPVHPAALPAPPHFSLLGVLVPLSAQAADTHGHSGVLGLVQNSPWAPASRTAGLAGTECQAAVWLDPGISTGPATVPVEVREGDAFVPSLALFLSQCSPFWGRLQTAFIVLLLVGYSVL